MNKTTPIKAVLGLRRLSAVDVLARGNAVLAGAYVDKDAYASLPIDQPTFKSLLDSLSIAISAALDGGRKAVAERERQTEIVVKSLRQIAHYVEANCKDDMTIFLKSGFQAATTTRTPATPESQWFRKIVAGKNTGQMEVSLMAQPDALSYQMRYATVAQGGTPGTWVEQPIGKTRSATVVSGLTPGTTYLFQVRAQTNSGYADWSESVTRIAT